MKKILLTFITAGALLAVSCTTEPVATETFIREDVVGEWTVNQVAYFQGFRKYRIILHGLY